MYFESLSAMWHMDGHGIYVWLAYALTAIPPGAHSVVAHQADSATLALAGSGAKASGSGRFTHC